MQARETRISPAQQEMLERLNRHRRIKIVMWGPSYYRMMDENNEWIKGRLAHVTFDAMMRRGLMKRNDDGFYVIQE